MTVQQYKNVMYLTVKNCTPDMQQKGNGKVKKLITISTAEPNAGKNSKVFQNIRLQNAHNPKIL